MTDAVDIAELKVVPRDIELLILAYACHGRDTGEVCAWFLECCKTGALRLAERIANMFELAADARRMFSELPERYWDDVRADLRAAARTRPVLSNSTDRPGGFIVLTRACALGDAGAAQWAMDYFGADACVRPNALHMLDAACYAGQLETAQWVVEHLDVGGDWGYVMVDHACRSGCVALAEWLIGRSGLSRANQIDIRTRALPEACREGHDAMARWLLGRHNVTAADLLTPDLNGMSAWTHAITRPDPSLANWIRKRLELWVPS